jgi:hypothetical protein
MMPVKLLSCSSWCSSSLIDGPQAVEQLAHIEPELTVAADVGNDGVEIVEHHVLLRAAPRVWPMRLLDRLANGRPDLVEEGLQIGRLPVRRDRHVGRREVQPDAELRVLGRLCDVVMEPATIEIDVALVASGANVASDWRPIHADAQVCISIDIRLFGPRLDDEGDFGVRLVGAEPGETVRARIGMVGERLLAHAAKARRCHPPGALPRSHQQPLGLLAGDVLAECSAEPGLRDNLTGLRAGAAVEV